MRITLLEPIKTAMCEGNHALARRLRTELLRDIIQELRAEWQGSSPPRSLAIVEDALDSLGIPEEP